jgi:GrpB-like predicted nucleotidyltransferase (UPF0157 family)
MTKEKVTLVTYDASWPVKYQEEKQRIIEAIGKYVLAIEHIGSTAIPFMIAKPVIDIQVGLKSLRDAVHCIPKLEKLGYKYLPEIESIEPNRRLFRKPSKGEKKYQIHMWKYQSEGWENFLLFRDYLQENSETSKEYEFVKKYMAKRFPENEVAYSIGKEGFIQVILRRAREESKRFRS